MSSDCTFSVIIPVLNEAEVIADSVRAVRMLAPEAQVIVADGGSQDTTVARAKKAGALTVLSDPGRGVQCNAGAAIATGQILLFLHADTRLPEGAFEMLTREFRDGALQVGTFRLAIDCNHWLFSLYAFFSRFDSVFTSFGDQCIVVRRAFFRRIGGFPDWPLFEDVRFLQKARARTTIRSFPISVTTSARRFQREGVLRQSLCNLWYVLQYLAGVSPHKLAAKYERHSFQNLDEVKGA